jgi:3-isopropylmalate/(R)-2-methylmalate dehydratase small subunit
LGRILVAGPQFGIGSSRETAVTALAGAGFTTVIAPSFGEIFRANCVRNRVLTATVDQSGVDALQDWLRARPGAELAVDLAACTVTTGDGTVGVGFDVDGFARRSLLDGIDEFDLLTAHSRQIDAVLNAIGPWTPHTTAATEGRP